MWAHFSLVHLERSEAPHCRSSQSHLGAGDLSCGAAPGMSSNRRPFAASRNIVRFAAVRLTGRAADSMSARSAEIRGM